MEIALEMQNITKRFGALVANDNVSLIVYKGEIHALVGENGAGKSTLMNILYGLVPPDSGSIQLFGKPVTIHDPHEALKGGVGMVHQHFMLAPSLTVLENVVLGDTPTRFGLIDKRKAEQRIAAIIQQYALKIDLNRHVYELSVGEMQRVEILKTLYRGAEILIMDEPTAVLTPQEVLELFKILGNLTAQGRSVIFITHKLKEVLAVANRVTVMRNGKVTGELIAKNTNENELACLMVGREVILRIEKSPASVKETVLQVTDLQARNDRGLPSLQGVSFELHRGEILGIAGVEGNGQSELIEVLTGLRTATSGSIALLSKDVSSFNPRKRREAGIAHIPEDRLRMGIEKGSSLEDNFILNCYYQKPFASGMFLHMGRIHQFSQELVRKFNIKASSTQITVSSLSGGNMQKLILAREMCTNPDVLIAAQPTRGVDIGAIEYIHRQIVDLRDQGHAILLISAELDEITSLSDRILVMYEGLIVGEFEPKTVTDQELGLYMAGAGRGNPTLAATRQDEVQA
ncbi:MAG: ABC transporter ATP-binding protein [Anaerolineaceae bacterium]